MRSLIHSPDAVIHSPANRSRLPYDGHEIAMPARFCSENAETVLLIVEGDTLDHAGQHFLRRRLRFWLYAGDDCLPRGLREHSLCNYRDIFDAVQNDGDPSLRCNYLHLAGRSSALAGNVRNFGRKGRTVLVHSPLHKRFGGIN